MAGRRILVTGGSGHVGAHLVRRLLSLGHDVYVLSRRSDNPLRLEGCAVRLVVADLVDRVATARAVAEAAPDAVFHLASTPFNPPPQPEDHVRINVAGIDNLLAALSGPLPVIFAGSAAQYGQGDGLAETLPDRPSTLLGASKSAAAVLFHAHGRISGLQTIELRLFTPYGPQERPSRLVSDTVLSILAGRPVCLSGGEQERDFLYIDDLIDAMIAVLDRPPPAGTVINLCSGHGVKVRDIAAHILRLMGNPVPLLAEARPPRADEIWRLSGNNAKARELLGWTATTSLEEGLGRTISWIAANRSLAETLP